MSDRGGGWRVVARSYDMYVAQRSHVVQQMIRQAAGDMRLMNPVSLAENHASCRKNARGDAVLPNGQVWKPQLLLLCFASKILTEANSLLNLKSQRVVTRVARPLAYARASSPRPDAYARTLRSPIRGGSLPGERRISSL
eukprot:6012580-Pyramimonas_sp.AAC.3